MSYTYTMTYTYPPNLPPPLEMPPFFPPKPMPIFKEEAAQKITELLIELAEEESRFELVDKPIDTATYIEPLTVDAEYLSGSDTKTVTVTTSTLNALAYVLVKRRKLLEFYVNKLVADILAYCNRRDFPEPLIYTVVELLHNKINNSLTAADTGTPAPLSKIKQDDVEFSFAVSAVNFNEVFGEKLFTSLKPNLNLYRKVKSL